MVVNKVGKEIPQTVAENHLLYEGELTHVETYKEASRKIKPVLPNEKKSLGVSRKPLKKLV